MCTDPSRQRKWQMPFSLQSLLYSVPPVCTQQQQQQQQQQYKCDILVLSVDCHNARY